MAMNANGLLSPPQTEKSMSTTATPPKIVITEKNARILCVADIRGDYHELNKLIREHDATAVIHTGDFGFLTADSLDRMGDKILRHLLQYSPLIAEGTRRQLLNIPPSAGRQALISALEMSSIHFPLSQFPHLLSGAITFPVPVFTVWGLIEDVRVMEKFRTGEYEVKNLNVIDEASSRLLEVGGLKMRIFGLGGAVSMHKLFDHGEGKASIAGGQGTMWATALQIGELVDNAERIYDASETRLFIASAPIPRWGLLEQTALALKADLTISAGLHFRYPASFNAFSVHGDFDQYQQKFMSAQKEFTEVYGLVKDKIGSAMTASNMRFLRKASQVCETVPQVADEAGWTSVWHWILTTGVMNLSINDGRVSAEMKSQGLHFGHRNSSLPAPPNAPQSNSIVQPRRVEPHAAPANRPTAAPARSAEPASAPTKILAKPTEAPAAANNRGIPPKPAQPPQGPKATTTPATNSINTQKPPSSIPPKPMAPSRQPRGPGSVAPTPAASANKVENKPVPASATSASKAPAPAGNRKSPAPGPKADKAPLAPSKLNAETGDKKADPAPIKTEKKEAGEKSEEVPSGPLPARPYEKRSLFLKKIPIPTSDEEIKALFPNHKSKITNVKIPYDHIRKQQKEFAYVDFATEADAQEALKNHEEKIRDTTISIVPSNPPKAAGSSDFSGRGRGGSRGIRGSRGGGRGGLNGGPTRSDSTGGDKGTVATGAGDKKAAPAPAAATSAPAPVAAKKD